MPSREEFRKALLIRRPDLRGRLCLNRLVHNDMDFSVTVRGLGTIYWIGVDEELEKSVKEYLGELDDLEDWASGKVYEDAI